MSLLYLVRLGETENNVAGRISGRRVDSPLTDRGKEQAAKIADLLAPTGLTAIYSSPSPRVLETARPLADRIGLEPQVERPLQEIDLGDLDGLSRGEIRSGDTAPWFFDDLATKPIPGATESLRESQSRALGVVAAIVPHEPEVKVAGGQPGNVAAFTHGGTLRLILLGLLGPVGDLRGFWRLHIGNASVAVVERLPGEKWLVRELLNFGSTIVPEFK